MSSDECRNQTAEEDAFLDRVTQLNNMAKLCAEETIYRAELYPADRNTILRAVISRLKDALS